MAESEGAAYVGASFIDAIDALMLIATAIVAVMPFLPMGLLPYSFPITEAVIPLVLSLMVTAVLQTVFNFDPPGLNNGGEPTKNHMEEVIGSDLAL